MIDFNHVEVIGYGSQHIGGLIHYIEDLTQFKYVLRKYKISKGK